MRRFWIAMCIVCGVALLAAALLVPAHSRAVDSKAIESAGIRTPGLVEEGLTLVQLEKVGPAQKLFLAAQTENVAGLDRLAKAISQFKDEHPDLAPWGGADPSLEKAGLPVVAVKQPVPVVDLLMQRATRDKALQFLNSRSDRRPGLRHFLANRSLTNTVHFPSATTASGQAFDGAVVIAGLLYQADYLTPNFRDAVEFLAMDANRGKSSESLELVYLDLISLGKRLDWISLVELMKKVEGIPALRQLADAARGHEEQFNAIFAALQISGKPAEVAKFLAQFPETGVNDLSFAAGRGSGGVELLLKQQHRIYYAGDFKKRLISYDPFGAWFYSMLPMTQSSPRSALLVKYFLLGLGCLCVARCVGFAAGQTQWFGLRFGADAIMALALAFIFGLMSEPFIGLPSQIHDLPVRFKIPVATLAPGSTLHTITKPFMNNNAISLIPLFVFFVIQALIYVWCLAKLNEIRRQPMGARMKLRLLDNEDHLFDAGLYIGFVGTIIALMLFMLGVSHFSAMSAYSSTSFGIIFVSVLKIFHIRPLRRKLILESEATA
jgi:hypothetical protein